MSYNFSTFPSRSNTGSLKWQKYAGKPILPFWVADMDFESAPEVIAALQARLAHGVFGYTKPYAEVEDSTLAYLKRVHGIEARASHLFWIPGLVPALNVAARAFGQPGDEILTCTPVYPPFLSAPDWQGKTLVTSDLKLEQETWTFDFADLEKKVTPRTKAFFLCNPHNPVGRVFRRDELEQLVDFCEAHDLILISDEIHCDLVFSGHQHIPTQTLGEKARKRTITLMAPSKTYNLPGLCCAYAVIENPDLRLAFAKAARGFITEVNAFGYAGCAAAYDHGEPWRQALMARLEANRDRLYAFVTEHLPEIQMWPMEATYLAWLKVDTLGLENPGAHFEAHGIGLSNGADFGDSRFLRLNFGCSAEQLEKGLACLEDAVRAARK